MKNIVKTIVVITAVAGISACSTSQQQIEANTPYVRIIARSDNLASAPSWATEQKTYELINDRVVVTGLYNSSYAGLPSGNVYRASESNAKRDLSNMIEQKLEIIFQNAEEGMNQDTNQMKSIITEVSQNVLHDTRVEGRYWEIVAINDGINKPTATSRVYVCVSIPEAVLKRLISDAITRRQGGTKLSAQFADKVNQRLDEMLKEDAE